jgi:hypothetical protein
MSTTIYFGAVINPVSLTEYSALPRCLVAVNANGLIDWIEEDVDPTLLQEALLKHNCEPGSVVELLDGQFLMPGFVDTHIVSRICVGLYDFIHIHIEPACISSTKHWHVRRFLVSRTLKPI